MSRAPGRPPARLSLLWVIAAIAAGLLPSSALAQSEPPPPLSPPPLMDAPPESEQPPPEYPSEAAEPGDGNRGQRLLFEGLGGLAGFVIGGLLPAWVGLATACQNFAPGNCMLAAFAPIAGTGILMPVGVWLAGRAFGGEGGFWWGVLGEIPGWAVALCAWMVAVQSTTALFASPAELMAFGAVGVLPALAGAILVNEWSTSRARSAREKVAIPGVGLLPVFGSDRAGLALAGTF